MRLTADLKARLREAIDGEGWDRPGETTERDAALAHVEAVPTGTVLDPGEDEFDADEQPLTDLAHAWVTADYFGFANVAGDWQDRPDHRPDPENEGWCACGSVEVYFEPGPVSDAEGPGCDRAGKPYEL